MTVLATEPVPYPVVLHDDTEGIWVVDSAGITTFVNRAMERILGRCRTDIVGRPLAELLRGPARERVAERLARRAAGFTDTYETSVAWPCGHERALHVTAQPVRDSGGRFIASLAIVLDLTQARHAADGLRRSEELRRAILATSYDLIWTADADGRMTYVSHAVEVVLGLTAPELVGRPLTDIVAPEGVPEATALIARVLSGATVHGYETRIVHGDGSLREVAVSAAPQRAADGSVIGLCGTTRDLTDPRRALEQAQAEFRQVFQNAPIGMALVDLDPACGVTFRETNRAMCRVLGLAPDALVGPSRLEVLEPADEERERREVAALLAGDADSYMMEKRYARPDGTSAWVTVHVSAVRDREGHFLYAVKQVQDVTDRRRLEEQLRHQADHDQLTGLFNRRRMEQELARQVGACRDYGESAAVLVLDLDSFKDANDTFGHAVGDQLIRAVAQRLHSRLGAADVLARPGGDEFAVIVPRCDAAEAQRRAEELLTALRERPLCTPGVAHPLRMSASCGVAVFGQEAESGADLLALADVAMYQAKANGGDACIMHDPTSGHQAEMAKRIYWVQRLREALELDQFELFSQPILDLSCGVTTHEELLIRLRDDEGGLTPPGVFLPVAESAGLMPSIDRWVIRAAIELAHRQALAGEDRVLEVNLSAQSLTDATLGYIECELARKGVDPCRLLFEITETAAIRNVEHARRFTTRLRSLGCAFALDDFGAGYGSFYYIKHLPFDVLKIDGEFIRTLPDSPEDQVIVRSIVDAARGLGKRTVAEFVEDQATLELLREWGVDYAQGYHVAKPAPVVWPPKDSTEDGAHGTRR
jgi:diguanylate cyclase (GGDEF)-like protein/PAS domain S-box-containing protein